MTSRVDNELLKVMLPLWLALPDIPRYSIGWRMGEGDDYSWEFSKWWDGLSLPAQQEYQRRYPEPVGWQGWYREEDLDEGDESEDGYELDGV